MSFATEFRYDRKMTKGKVLRYSKLTVSVARERILDQIVLAKFYHLHQLAPTAIHFRVTFRCDVNGVITYNTRRSGDFMLKDPVLNNITKDILSAAVMLVENARDDPSQEWAEGISADEDYDTDDESMVYTFEFCG